MSGHQSGPDEVSLLARVVAALQDAGRMVRADWEIGTMEVSPDDGGEPVVGVVLPHAQRVCFYSVRPRPAPADRLPAISELAHRLNTELHTACWELNPDTGILAVRSGFEFDSVAGLTAEQRSSVIRNCLLEVEMVAQEARPLIDAVEGGAEPLAVLADRD